MGKLKVTLRIPRLTLSLHKLIMNSNIVSFCLLKSIMPISKITLNTSIVIMSKGILTEK
jgi:hypothetical protein